MKSRLFHVLGLMVGCAGLARADHVTIDFSHGAPPANVAVIAPTSPLASLNYSGGHLNVLLPTTNDGVQITPTIFNAACFIFSVNTVSIPTNAGLSFGVASQDGVESIDLSMKVNSASPSGSPDIILKAVRQFNGIVADTYIIGDIGLTVAQYNSITNLKYIRFDCLENGQVQVEFVTGIFNRNYVVTIDDHFGLCNGGMLVGRLKNVSGIVDPPVSASLFTLDLDTVHVPEPSSIILVGIGSLLAVTWPSLKQRVVSSE